MSNLYNNLRKVQEETTSDAIAYAPGSLFGAHTSDVLTPNFPGLTKNWDDLKRTRKRKRQMREAIDDKVNQLHLEIIQELKNVAFATKLTYNQYVKAFNYTKDLTPDNILIDLLKKEADSQLIINALGEDLGELQLILSALQAKQPLNKFEELQKYEYIAGCRLQSVPLKTVTFIYEGVLDQEYIERETIIISDSDIVKALQQKSQNKLITSGKWTRVYPIDRYFDTNFYNMLLEILKSDFDEFSQEDQDSDDDERTEEEKEDAAKAEEAESQQNSKGAVNANTKTKNI